MLNTMNVIEIMRLTDAVYESDTLTIGQNIDSFTEISNPSLKKRYIKFENHNSHNKYQAALKHNLENLGNGDAVITMKITEKDGQFILSDKGFVSATFVDLSKVTDNELMILIELVSNTLKKMQLSNLQKELESTQTKANKMKAGIKEIHNAADKTKSGIGSRNVNALKKVINDITENTK